MSDGILSCFEELRWFLTAGQASFPAGAEAVVAVVGGPAVFSIILQGLLLILILNS